MCAIMRKFDFPSSSEAQNRATSSKIFPIVHLFARFFDFRFQSCFRAFQFNIKCTLEYTIPHTNSLFVFTSCGDMGLFITENASASPDKRVSCRKSNIQLPCELFLFLPSLRRSFWSQWASCSFRAPKIRRHDSMNIRRRFVSTRTRNSSDFSSSFLSRPVFPVSCHFTSTNRTHGII